MRVSNDLSATEKTLIISNWPAYIDPQEEADLDASRSSRSATGITVDYTDDINDNAEFFAKVKNQLGACQPIGRDIIMLTDWMAARMIGLGWIQPLDHTKIPNVARQPDPAAANRPGTPTRDYTPLAERADRHRLQRRSKTEEVKSFDRAAHPPRPQGQGHAAHRDARHDGLHAQDRRARTRTKFTAGRVGARRIDALEKARRGRPGPGVHRQRLHPGPRAGQHRRLRGVVRRRDPAAVRQPGHQVRRARGGPVPLERQHDGPEPGRRTRRTPRSG